MPTVVTSAMAWGVATYNVSLVINGQVKASIANAKTQAGKPAQLNFNVTGQMASAKKHTHMVWLPDGASTQQTADRIRADNIAAAAGTGPGSTLRATLRKWGGSYGDGYGGGGGSGAYGGGAGIGSHSGGGRWVEVDDNGNIVNNAK